MNPRRNSTSGIIASAIKCISHIGVALVALLVACVPATKGQMTVKELPDPKLYTLTLTELPSVGTPWEQSYYQYTENESFKWLYIAFESQKIARPGNDPDLHLSINNDIAIYVEDISKGELPLPPLTLGATKDITWQPASLLYPVGDKSAAWQTILGDSQVPVWWLEFYKGHVYGRISLFGFPLDETPSLGNSLAQQLISRLPESIEELVQDATQHPSSPPTSVMATDRSTENEPTSFPSPAPPTPTRIEPTPTQGPLTSQDVLAFLVSLPAKDDRRVVAGQNLGHGDSVVEGYDKFVTGLERTEGSTVAMIGVDYGWNTLHPEQIQASNQVLIEHWKRGGLVTISTHVGNPFFADSQVHDRQGVNLIELITPGTTANSTWLSQLDVIASGLSELQEAGVIVLWRPFHEMNGGWFWWCSSKYYNGGWTPREDFIALWQHMYHYFTIEKELDNLLWVYSPAAQYDQDIRPTDYYYPGNDYVDIVGYTFYSDQFTIETMDVNESYSRLIKLGKPLAITETGPRLRDGSFDTTRLIAGIRQVTPMISYFVFWHSWISDGQFRHVAIVDNKNAAGLLSDPWVLTLGELPFSP